MTRCSLNKLTLVRTLLCCCDHQCFESRRLGCELMTLDELNQKAAVCFDKSEVLQVRVCYSWWMTHVLAS